MPVRRPTALLCLLLAACAPAPLALRLMNAEQAQSPPVWPAPPEQPRYRFAGQLTGEQNLVGVPQAEPSLGTRVLRWIVGLDEPAAQRERRVLLRPQSGMVDAGGRVLVTDVGRAAVFVFSAAPAALDIWEAAGPHEHLVTPVGIAPGPGDQVLVADAGLGRVVRLSGGGEPRGVIGHPRLLRPTGLARDARSGHIFVADSQAHDIKVFDDAGTLLRTIGRRGTGPGEFNGPTHLAIAGAHLYVADTLNARIQVLGLDGRPERTIGSRGLYVGNLVRPKGVTVDGDGNVYVIESYYDYLLVFDPSGRFLLSIGGTGSAIGEFVLPAGTWSDPGGHIYVADMFNGRVVIFQHEQS